MLFRNSSTGSSARRSATTGLIDYRLPPELIAQSPASPRDAARLLIYDRKRQRTTEDVFRNIVKYLPPRSIVVLNQTKVIPARLTLTKPTGGMVRVLYLGHDRRYVRALADRRLTPNTRLSLRGVQRRSNPESHTGLLRHGVYPVPRHGVPRNDRFVVVRRSPDGHYLLKPSFPTNRVLDVLNRFGTTPLPPYLKHSPLSENRRRSEYQTVFARTAGSVAAPTAALHFTKKLLATLQHAGHDIEYVTLHVNLGTFAPVTIDQLRTGRLHKEQYEFDSKAAARINAAKHDGRPIIAVGTTAVRALESAADERGRLNRISGATSLFIRPGYKFKIVDGLITNFHVPRSSLLLLVAALTGRSRLTTLYRRAIRQRFRFLSFGDASLIT